MNRKDYEDLLHSGVYMLVSHILEAFGYNLQRENRKGEVIVSITREKKTKLPTYETVSKIMYFLDELFRLKIGD